MGFVFQMNILPAVYLGIEFGCWKKVRLVQMAVGCCHYLLVYLALGRSDLDWKSSMSQEFLTFPVLGIGHEMPHP